MKIYDFGGKKNISGQYEKNAEEAISKIETGDRFITDYELMVFSRVLGVSVNWLMGEKGPEQ